MASVLKVDTIKSLAGNEAMTITESGVPLLKVPYFRVQRTTNQSLTSAQSTTVQFNEVVVDTHSWWDPVNYVWTPQIAGYYYVTTTLHLTGTSPTRRICNISFTGDGNIRAFDTSSTTGVDIQTGGGVGYFNGTTDSVSISVTVTATTPVVTGVASGEYSRFEGFLVRAA